MKFRFTIAKKLTLGFGILALAVIISSTLTYLTLQQNREINEKISDIYTPSVNHLNDLFFLISNSKMLIKNWVFIEYQDDTPDKIKLKELHSEDFPKIKDTLSVISKKWDDEAQEQLNKIFVMINDTLFERHKYIINKLNDFESYNNPMITFEINPMVEKNGEVIQYTDKILEELSDLLDRQRERADQASVNMEESFDGFQRFIIIMGIISLLIAIVTAFLTIRSLTTPINRFKKILLSMSKGILTKEKLKKRTDEIGEMSEALTKLTEGLRKTSQFALEIGKGNLEAEFSPLSEQDNLGNSLLIMRSELKKAVDEEEKRKAEDEERNWVSRGIAKFGEILRLGSDDIKELCYEVISNLVKYVDANQAGIFILNDYNPNDKFLELTAVFAFDRKKYAKKRIDIDDGIIGSCFLEKQTIYLEKIPEDYVHITSGLGKSNPRSLLLVPLKLNEEVYGVLEMASFERFTPTKIEFIEKIGENMASTISNIKVTERTSKLLHESRQKSEQLQQQDEEMRQNMEEIQATQEEAKIKVNQATNIMDALERTDIKLEIKIDGTISKVNRKFLQILELRIDEVLGESIDKFIAEKKRKEFNNHWQKIARGEIFETILEFKTYSGEDIFLMLSFTPIKNRWNEFDKILCIGKDISQLVTATQKQESEELEEML